MEVFEDVPSVKVVAKTLRLLRASLLLSAFISARVSADLLEFELGITKRY